jgi:hypothetical protein
MGRSIHQTFKRVFGGKSKTEVNDMFRKGDPDAMALVKKIATKKRVKRERAASRIDPKKGSATS